MRMCERWRSLRKQGAWAGAVVLLALSPLACAEDVHAELPGTPARIALADDSTQTDNTAGGQAPLPPDGAMAARVMRKAPFKIVLTGDSTVATEGGWGPGFCQTLTSNVACVDLAKNGRSSKSFVDEGLWKAALAEKGQYYFIQFGHNDQKDDPARHTDADTTYAANLKRFIADVRAIGAVPILVSPLSRRTFNERVLADDGLKQYAAAARRVAAEEHVSFVDLFGQSQAYLQTRTQAEADTLNAATHTDAKAENAGPAKPDRTHLNDAGKTLFGRMVADIVVRTQVELSPNIKGSTDLHTLQTVAAQAKSDGNAMAATVRRMWPSGVIATQARPGAWAYEVATLLDGMAAVGGTGNVAYVCATVDRWVDADGSIFTEPGKPFNPAPHTLDNLEPGRAVLFCYRKTGQARYAKAATYLFKQFAEQPRNGDGGYWHKEIYPDQMWLDGAYMAEPFRAAYAHDFNQSADFDDIARQFLLMYDHMRVPATGLLRHGWDAARKQPWADKQTGLSQEVWARAMGWYAMALVDTLPSFPADHPMRSKLIDVLQQVAQATANMQDPDTGTWWDVMDKGGQPGNFREASATAMFTYAFAKGVRLGYLPDRFYGNAVRGWQGLQTQFITRSGDTVTLHGTVKVSGLGGNPYRAGDYNYYVREAVGDDDAKGVGAYLLAASELAAADTAVQGRAVPGKPHAAR